MFEPPSHFPLHPTPLGWNRAPIWVRKLFLKMEVGAVGWVEFSHLTCWRWALRSQELLEEPIIIHFSFFLAQWSGKITAPESTPLALWNAYTGIFIYPWKSQTGAVTASVSRVFISLMSWAFAWWENEKVLAPRVSATLSSLLSAPYNLGAFTPVCPFVLTATLFQGGLQPPWIIVLWWNSFYPLETFHHSKVQNPDAAWSCPLGSGRDLFTNTKDWIQKTKIMASSPITSWQIGGETVETVADFIFFGFKITMMVTTAMRFKDTCSLEEKLWQSWWWFSC